MKLYVLIIAHLEPDTVIFAILARIFANKKDQKGMNKWKAHHAERTEFLKGKAQGIELGSGLCLLPQQTLPLIVEDTWLRNAEKASALNAQNQVEQN